MGRGMYERMRRAIGTRARRLLGRGTVHDGLVAEPGVAAVFDAAYYRETYADVSAAGMDPLAHYLRHGREELRRPSALFDPAWYLERYPEVAEAGLDPLLHFLSAGGVGGRDPLPVGFSSQWYLDQHPEVAEAGTNPLVHYVTEGVVLGYDPTPYFETEWYLSEYLDVAAAGVNPLTHYLRRGADEGRLPNARGLALDGGPAPQRPVKTVEALLAERNHDLRPLRVIPGPDVPRINLVTDSVGSDSLFGGVATAVVLATLWAERTGRRLRIVTRHAAPDGSGLEGLFRTIGRRPARQPELAFVPPGPGDFLDAGDDDLFLTTSWWTTAAVLRTVPADRVVYILQEDERSFYALGNQSIAAAATMDHPDLRVVVNTAGLLEHLAGTGLENLNRTGVAFEPSAAAFLRPGRLLATGETCNLFFYARPNNPRNLFDMGLAAIDGAVEAGHLPADRWRIHMVGRDVPNFTFCDGSAPVVHDSLGWHEYRELLGSMDVGVSLMASPHPSYPPLDLAAGGSVVVTNTWRGKPDLSVLGGRVVTAEPTASALVEAIGKATVLLDTVRDEPFTPPPAEIFRPWTDNLERVVDGLARGLGDV